MRVETLDGLAQGLGDAATDEVLQAWAQAQVPWEGFPLAVALPGVHQGEVVRVAPNGRASVAVYRFEQR